MTKQYTSITELPKTVQDNLPSFAQDGWLSSFNKCIADGQDQQTAEINAWRNFIRGDYGELLRFPDGRHDSAGNLLYRLRCLHCQVETDASDVIPVTFPHGPNCDIPKVLSGELEPLDIPSTWS